MLSEIDPGVHTFMEQHLTIRTIVSTGTAYPERVTRRTTS